MRKKTKKKYKEDSAFDAMENVKKGITWEIAFMNFVDGFRRKPSYALVSKKPDSSNSKLFSLLQSICIALFEESGLELRGWLQPIFFLKEPWFVAGVPTLMASALKESPIPFRRNNIFVFENILARV